MNILFLSLSDPQDKSPLSGMVYSTKRVLEQYHKVEWIGKHKFTFFQKVVLYSLKIISKILRYPYPLGNTSAFSKFYAKNMQSIIDKREYDVVFACLGSGLLANLEFKKPVIYFTDAVFSQLNGYYFKKVPNFVLKECNSIEKLALMKAAKIVVSSSWAKNAIISDYNISSHNIKIVDLGSNFETHCLKQPESMNGPLELLFIGVNWERKGGDLSYLVFQELLGRGIKCNFTIVGCDPKFAFKRNVTIIPFLNKNVEKDYKKLVEIWKKSHLLILPSKADCTPIVFSEAASFGVPVLSTKTGGIESVIIDGVNGYTFPLNASYKDYADKIENIFNNKQEYIKLSNQTFNQFNDRLNWNTWAKKINEIISEITK